MYDLSKFAVVGECEFHDEPCPAILRTVSVQVLETSTGTKAYFNRICHDCLKAQEEDALPGVFTIKF